MIDSVSSFPQGIPGIRGEAGLKGQRGLRGDPVSLDSLFQLQLQVEI